MTARCAPDRAAGADPMDPIISWRGERPERGYHAVFGPCWLIHDTLGGLPRAGRDGVNDLSAVGSSSLVPGRRIGSSCLCRRSRGRGCRPRPPGSPGERSGRGRWRSGPAPSWAVGVTMRRSPWRTGRGGSRGSPRRNLGLRRELRDFADNIVVSILNVVLRNLPISVLPDKGF